MQVRLWAAPSSHRAQRALGKVVLVTALLGLVAAGCSSGDEAGDEPGTSTAVAGNDLKDVVKPPGEPKRGGTLVMGLEAESEGFNPVSNRMAASALTIAFAVFDPLVALDADGKAHPYLAESLTPSTDYKTWTVKLRSGVKFHDGTPLDSAALKKFMDKFKASPLNASAAKPILAVDVVDDLTVKYTLDQAWSAFPYFLTAQAGIVPAPSQLDDAATGSTKPVGTGPFRYVDWQRDRSFVVERNPEYWRAGLPYLDRVEFKPISNEETRINALKGGNIDVMTTPRERSMHTLVEEANAGRLQVVAGKGDQDANLLMFNTAAKPFDDIRLRKAVAYAIDKEQLVAASNSDPKIIADSVYAKDSKWYADVGFPGYDATKAKALVDEVKAEKGAGAVTVTLSTVTDPELLRSVEIERSQLAAVGFDVKVNQVEQATLVSNVVGGKYEVATWRQFGASDPDLNYTWWIGDNAGNGTEGTALNMARLRDPEIDKALRAARATTDEAARKAAYKTVQQRHADLLPYVWTTHVRYALGAANKVHGIQGGTLPDGGTGRGMTQGFLSTTALWVDP